jgi:NADH-quinone oxidoreductase subunit F
MNPKPSLKNKPVRLSVKERCGNFHEVASGLTGEQAHNEANRCLRCDIKCEDSKK